MKRKYYFERKVESTNLLDGSFGSGIMHQKFQKEFKEVANNQYSKLVQLYIKMHKMANMFGQFWQMEVHCTLRQLAFNQGNLNAIAFKYSFNN